MAVLLLALLSVQRCLPRSVVAVVVDSSLFLLAAVSADIPATGTVHIATAVEAADYLDVVCKVGVDGEVRHDGLLVCVCSYCWISSFSYVSRGSFADPKTVSYFVKPKY